MGVAAGRWRHGAVVTVKVVTVKVVTVRVVAASVLVLSGLALAGCTLVYGPSSREAPPIAAADYCAEYARFACEASETCCPPLPSLRVCIETLRSGCVRDFQVALQTPRLGYDPALAGQHLAEGRALVANHCSSDIVAWYAETGVIFAGTLGEADECLADGMMPSLETFFVCAGDRACSPNVVGNWTCQRRVGEGAACAYDGNCTSPLFCDGSPRVCQRPRMDGQGCVNPNECASLVCAAGLCVPVPGDGQAYCAMSR